LTVTHPPCTSWGLSESRGHPKTLLSHAYTRVVRTDPSLIIPLDCLLLQLKSVVPLKLL